MSGGQDVPRMIWRFVRSTPSATAEDDPNHRHPE
jgi:hypothetical protein